MPLFFPDPVHCGADLGLLGDVMSIDPGQKVLREVVLEQLTTGENHAYRMWLPPLADPTPVNELIARDYDRRSKEKGPAISGRSKSRNAPFPQAIPRRR